jgi:hypothetical protein
MPFAIVSTVNLEGQDLTASKERLIEAIPRMKARPGFHTARFVRSLDGTRGVGMLIYDTQANAQAVLDIMTTDRPADAPPVISSAVYEVVLEV